MTFKNPENIRSIYDLRHIDRLASGGIASPPAPQSDLPFPDHDPADIISGPRIPLRYGSAPTEICVSKRLWRRTDRGDRFTFQGRWRSIDDWTDMNCVKGKWVRWFGVEGIAREDDEGFLYIQTADGGTTSCLTPAQVEVIQDDTHLNPFERAIAAWKATF